MTAKPIDTVFRDFVTEGVPASGNNKPKKAEIRDTLNQFFVYLTGANAGAIIKTSLAALNAFLTPEDNTMAWVVGDPDPDNDGVYERTVSAGGWTRRAPLPYPVIHLNNAGTGTADAIVVTTAVGVPSAAYKALYVLNIIAANTGPVTVAINGGAAKPLVGNTGNELGAEYLQPGMAVLCVDDGTNLRMLSYGDVVAVTEAAADRAEAAAASVSYATAPDKAALKAVDTTAKKVAYFDGSNFEFQSGDYSTEATTDTAEGVYVKADAIATDVGIWVRQFEGGLDPEWFVEDADDDYQPAFVRALALGKRVNGRERTYDIGGADLELPSGADIIDATFRDVNPGGTTRKTITSTDADAIRLRGVTLDRNGDGTGGERNTSGGIFLTGGSGHILDTVEVYGDDMGDVLRVAGASRVDIIHPYVHDVNYLLDADPGDDMINAIRVLLCDDVNLVMPRSIDIGGDYGSGLNNNHTRGIVFGGVTNARIVAPYSRRVGQGFDFTGSDGNSYIEILGGQMRECYVHGWKFANTAAEIMGTSMMARDCGLDCFTFADTGQVIRTQNITLVNPQAFNPGYNGAFADAVGFRIEENTGYPRGIKLICPRAIDDQAVHTMVDGFRNGQGPQSEGSWNEIIGPFEAMGYTNASVVGFHTPVVRVGISADTSIVASATWTDVVFDVELDDNLNMHPAGSSATVNVFRDGYRLISGQASFEQGAGSERRLRVLLNGSTIIPTETTIPATNTGGKTTIPAPTVPIFLHAGDELTFQVWQNSGGALNLRKNETFFSVWDLKQ